MKNIMGLIVGVLSLPNAASAQRVLECQFVSVQPSSFVYGQWSFAADISKGHLAMLLVRPSEGTGPGIGAPFIRAFSPIADGSASVYHDISSGSGDNASTATFQMATTGADGLVTLDEWRFGGTEEYDRLTLRCPSHR